MEAPLSFLLVLRCFNTLKRVVQSFCFYYSANRDGVLSVSHTVPGEVGHEVDPAPSPLFPCSRRDRKWRYPLLPATM
jgi:hypothetical protein